MGAYIHVFNSKNIESLQIIAASAAAAISAGKIISIPTDTIYGLAGKFETSVINKIHSIKRRPQDKPFILALPQTHDYLNYVDKNRLQGNFSSLIESSWPGTTTFIFPKKPKVAYPAGESIAIRMPSPGDNLFFYKVLELAGPIVVPSLNITQSEPLCDLDSMKRVFGPLIDEIFFDEGFQPKSPSKIIDLNQSIENNDLAGKFKIIRE